MKPTSIRTALLLTGILTMSLTAAEKPKYTANYTPLAIALTEKFIRQPETDAAALAAFKTKEGIVGGKLTAEFDACVALAKEIVADGVTADSPHFGAILGASVGVVSPAQAKSEAVTPPKSAEPSNLTAEQHAEAALSLQIENLSKESPAPTAKIEKLKSERNLVQANLNVTSKRTAWDTAKTNYDKSKSAADAAKLKKAEDELMLAEKAQQKLVAESDPIPKFAHKGPVSFIHAGVRLLSPYKFNYDTATSTATLDKTSTTDTTTFIEFVYANRTAWSPFWLAQEQEHLVQHPKGKKNLLQSFKDWWGSPDLNAFDFETRIGYNFSGTDNSASAVAGSGDFSAEISAGLPLGVYLLTDTDWRDGGWSIGPEISYAMTTDKSAFDARERLFAGIGYSLSYNLSSNPEKPRWLLLHTRLGKAWIDTAEFLNETSLQAKVTNGNLPLYSKQEAVAFETEVIYPLGEDSHLTFGGRIYEGPKPNAWTLYFGYTKSISDIAKALFPTLGGDGKKDPAEPSTPKL